VNSYYIPCIHDFKWTPVFHTDAKRGRVAA
jgi:hypothetical protein